MNVDTPLTAGGNPLEVRLSPDDVLWMAKYDRAGIAAFIENPLMITQQAPGINMGQPGHPITVLFVYSNDGGSERENFYWAEGIINTPLVTVRAAQPQEGLAEDFQRFLRKEGVPKLYVSLVPADGLGYCHIELDPATISQFIAQVIVTPGGFVEFLNRRPQFSIEANGYERELTPAERVTFALSDNPNELSFTHVFLPGTLIPQPCGKGGGRLRGSTLTLDTMWLTRY